MHISIHLILCHEIHIKYVKRKPPQTIKRRNESKIECSVELVIVRIHIF